MTDHHRLTRVGTFIQAIALEMLLTAVSVAASAAEPTAHQPAFNETSLWPEDVQKTAYAKETWPAAPLYVWAATGKNGAETDPKDPANWTVDGKTASAPPDQHADVLFPTGTSLRIQDNDNVSLTVRHVTVSANFTVVKPLWLKPLGNVWIKAGGSVAQMGNFTGPKNVFLRNDNRDFRKGNAAIANKVVFNKPVGSSLEIIGTVMAWDEMGFFCGTVVVGPDARLVPGNRSSQPVYPDARLALMSGASFHKRGNQPYEIDLVVSGELTAGTPERPLLRDCTLGLSFKTKGEKGLVDNSSLGSPSDVGMVVNPQGKFLVHSADPQKARLVITWNGLSSRQHEKSEEPDPISRTIDLVLQGTVARAGIHVDHVRVGGIHLADQTLRTTGAFTFGEHNVGKPDQLFTLLEKPLDAKLVFSAAAAPVPASQGGGKDSNPREND